MQIQKREHRFHRMEQMSAEKYFPHKDLTYGILGAFFKVYNTLGYGFLESVYSRAMAHELAKRGLHVDRERLFEVAYDGVSVGHYRADQLVNGLVLVEVKAAAQLGDADRRQVLNYLRATGLEVALLLHFGPKAFHQRFVHTPHVCADQHR
jgi:GxxExxY protein